MSTSQDKRFIALEIVLRELNSRIIKEIKVSNESEIDKILSEPEFWLSFVQSALQQEAVVTTNIEQINSDITRKPAKSKQSRKKEVITEKIIQVAERLKNAHSREEGKTIVFNEDYTVEQLKLLAKHLDISIKSSIKKSDLIEKIIQETIGYRIDSMIIQDHKWDK